MPYVLGHILATGPDEGNRSTYEYQWHASHSRGEWLLREGQGKAPQIPLAADKQL
jgi:hypothetical protein